MSVLSWDLTQHLVVEASAGTGKTYTISTLVGRLVAEEGLPIRQMLVTTFTEAAASELRHRIRSRLLEMAREDGEYLRSVEGAQRAERMERLLRAAHDLDQATISTIHGFCRRVLAELPFEANVDMGRTLVEDAAQLREAALADAWARLAATRAPAVSASAASALAQSVMQHLELPVVPALGARGEAGAPDPEAAVAALLKEAAVMASALPLQQMTEHLMASRTSCKDLKRLMQILDLPEAGGERLHALHAWLQALHADYPDDAFETALAKATPVKHASLRDAYAAHGRAIMQQARALEALERQQVDAARVQLAHEFRAALEARRRREGVMTFHDMLLDVHAALRGPAATALQQAVRQRYKVVLVDEFQDTDAVQCQIFRQLFEGSECRVCFIGDPKQSIYLFRGADLEMYMEATRPPAFQGATQTLDTSWRTDRPLLDAVDALLSVDGTLGGAAGKMQGIALQRLKARHQEPRLVGPDGAGASGLRVLYQPPPAEDEQDDAGELKEFEMLERVAECIRQELSAGLRVKGEHGDRPLGPGDCAVLMNRNRGVDMMQAALRRKGIPTVSRTQQSVWDTTEADELARVLGAVAEPSSVRRRRAAAATEVAGVDAQALILRDAEADAAVASWVLAMRAALEQGGPVPWVRQLLDGSALPGKEPARVRLLSRPGGERSVTNLLHLAEMLGDAWRTGVRTAGELADIMLAARTDGGPDGEGAETSLQRVESDGAAVEVLTMHRAKGLEWPVVWLPSYAVGKWTGTARPDAAYPMGSGADRVLAVAGAERDLAEDEFLDRSDTEKFRVLYVALTRARHRCNVVWASASGQGNAASPLAQVLHGRAAADRASAIADAKAALKDGGVMLRDLQELHARATADGRAGVVVVERLPQARTERWKPTKQSPHLVDALDVSQPLPAAARTTSFSGLTAGAHESFGEHRVRVDDAQQGESAGGVAAAALAPLLSRRTLPAGPAYGDLVHRILQEGLQDGLHEAVEAGAQGGVRGGAQAGGTAGSARFAAMVERLCAADGGACDAPTLAEGLRSMAQQRLLAEPVRGVDTGAATLSELTASGARAELAFLLPAGGPRPVTVAALAKAFEQGDEWTAQYAPLCAQLDAPALRGHLVGFIDLVCCWQGRWFVLDYKTNALGTTVEAFTPERIQESMLSSHYVLQYHLYVLAVHRWLRTRVPGYRYGTHFGGALYLYVRAMGQGLPAGSGVFAHRPTQALVEQMDQLFRGGDA